MIQVPPINYTSSVVRLSSSSDVKLTVYGKPVPQGSTRAFIPKGWKHAVITSDNKELKPWRQELSDAMLFTRRGGAIRFPEGPVAVTLDFYFQKPSSAPQRRIRPTVKPDLDKICRACFDAMTGILITDDAQIVDAHPRKFYGTPERVEITVREL